VMEEKVRFVVEYEQDERTTTELYEVYGIKREGGHVRPCADINSFRSARNRSRTREVNHEFFLHIGISRSLRHLNLQLSELENGPFHRSDLAWVPNAQLVVASRPSREL
jgi:hypothetical protein